MKKLLLMLVLVVIIAGGISAQSNERKNWASGEISLIGVGARYEYMLNPHFSVGVNAYWSNLFFFWHDWGITGNARFYPWSGTFFMELGLGYCFHSGFDDYSVTNGDVTYTGNDWVGNTGFGIVPGIGWRISAGKSGGFFMQPGIKLPIIIGYKKPILDDWWMNKYKGKFGSSMGFVMSFGFGYAF